MSSNISINSGAQQVAANSGSSIRQAGKSGQSDDKFSDHFADAGVDKKAHANVNEGGQAAVDSELPSEDNGQSQILAPKVEVSEIAVADAKAVEGALEDLSLEIAVKTDDAQQGDVKPVATDVVPSAEGAEEVVVPAAIVSAEAGKDTNTTKSQSEGAAASPVAAANAKTVSARRDNLKADQGQVENKDLAAGEADDDMDTAKPSRTMERPLERTVGRGRANAVIQAKVDGERGMNPEQAANNNSAARAERAAGSPNAFGARGVEGRLASMMEASSAFDGDVKITVGKQEGHMLPAMPQQLTVSGVSRTLVSQVLELKRSGELELTGANVKTDVNKPIRLIEVQLMPRNLGTVGITIRNVAGRISIAIEVQGAEAERLIKAEVDKIAGAIRQAGQVVEDISIKRGVQTSQQTDSLTDDRGAGRQGEANLGQNPGDGMWQSSRGETDEASNRQRFGEIEVQERGEIAASADRNSRQGIYL